MTGMPMRQAYIFRHFQKACEVPSKVFVWAPALKDARKDFGLNSTEELLKFIVAPDGLERKKYKNTKPLESNATTPVDAYEFWSGKKFGYLAFFLNKRGNLWNLKSFKANDSTANRPAIQKSGNLKQEGIKP